MSTVFLLKLFFSLSGVQIATVQGGIRECGDVDYPGLFIRLDDPSIWNFIMETAGMKKDSGNSTFYQGAEDFLKNNHGGSLNRLECFIDENLCCARYQCQDKCCSMPKKTFSGYLTLIDRGYHRYWLKEIIDSCASLEMPKQELLSENEQKGQKSSIK